MPRFEAPRLPDLKQEKNRPYGKAERCLNFLIGITVIVQHLAPPKREFLLSIYPVFLINTLLIEATEHVFPQHLAESFSRRLVMIGSIISIST